MNFSWIDECETVFQELKDYLGRAPCLSKARGGENLLLYLVIFEVTVNSVLMRLEEGKELPIYYVSKALLDLETHYTNAKKLCLALVVATRKLHP